MQHRTILIADDTERRTDPAKKRSQAMHGAASFLAQGLNVGIDLIFAEDINTHSNDPNVSLRIRHSRRRGLGERRQYQVPFTYFLRLLTAVLSEDSPELIVVGTRSRKGLKRLVMGSLAERVVFHSKRPVMVIGPVAQEKGWDFNAQRELKILLATDLDKNSLAAEHYALSLAKRMGAGVVLFHSLGECIRKIVSDNCMFSGWAPINLDEILAGIMEKATETIEQKVAFFKKHNVSCRYKINDKLMPPARAIIEEGENGYSFLVMGTHGKNALLNAFFGSTAWETILNSSIPAITVHSVKYEL